MNRELIERAIESAKSRIYRLAENEKYGVGEAHQKKIDNQIEVMEVTIEALEKYAEYTELEEQGLLPKFHLGDCFWVEWLYKPIKAKVVMIMQKKDGTWRYRFCDEQSHTHDYEENEVGKYYWFTKEEALKKLKGEEHE